MRTPFPNFQFGLFVIALLSFTPSALCYTDVLSVLVVAEPLQDDAGWNVSCSGINPEQQDSALLQRPKPCNLDAFVTSLSPAVCYGTATGSAVISVNNGTPPLGFTVNGGGPTFSNGDLNNLFLAGNNFVVVQDMLGCVDTVFFTISQPDSISLSLSTTNVICNGDDTGTGTAVVSGGTGSLSVSWRGCAGGQTFNGLYVGAFFAGCYQVTATDANGCTVSRSFNISEPPPFTFSSIQDSVNCFGGSDGMATIFVGGGTPPYNYLWSNGQTTQMASGLNANFHTVAITDSLNCQAFTFVQVLQPGILKIDSVAVRAVNCFGDNNGTASLFVSGGTTPYSYLWNDPLMQTTKQAANLVTGFYSVTVTDYRGCSLSNNAFVPSPPVLNASFMGIVPERCFGSCDGGASVTASGGTPQYTTFWNTPGVPDGAFNPANLCAGSYAVTVQDAKGCQRILPFDLQPGVPILVNLSGVPPSCSGESNGIISNNSVGGQGTLQYLWSNGATTANLQNLACGTYTVTVTDANNCTRTASFNLVCPPPLLISSVSVTPSGCFGAASGTATVVVQGGTGTLEYAWNTLPIQTTATATGLINGLFTVTVTDANGCSATATANVGQASAIQNSFSVSHVTCYNGTNGSITANPSGGTPGYTYNWSHGNNQNPAVGLAAGNYTVTISDANGCSLVANAPPVVQPTSPLDATLTQTLRACSGQNNSSANVAGFGSNGPPYTYLWDNGQTTPDVTGLSTGDHFVTITDILGCATTKALSIAELQPINLTLAPVLPACNGLSNGLLAVNSISGGAGNGIILNYSFSWSLPGAQNSSVLDMIPGNTLYRVTATDLQGCTGSTEFFLAQPAKMFPEYTLQGASCYGSRDGNIRITNVLNANGSVSYNWSNGSSSNILSNQQAGTYTVTISDGAGCTITLTESITQPPEINISLSGTQLECTNEANGSIQAAISGGMPPYLYAWNTGATGSSLSNLSPGMYVLTVRDASNCLSTDSLRINRPDSIVLTTEKTSPSCYEYKDGRIKVQVTGGQPPYRYQINGGVLGGNNTFIGLGAGPYSITIRDAGGCGATLQDTLTQPEEVLVSITPDTTIRLGQALTLTASAILGVGQSGFTWDPVLTDSINCLDPDLCDRVFIKPHLSNIYQVVATDENGCTGSNRVSVTVEKIRDIYVPTGFSPDGNQANDRLVVHGDPTQVLAVRLFRVFDRWGSLVFEDRDFSVNDATRGWDGLMNGKSCDPGVFVWYLEVVFIDGFTDSLRGQTTLIR